jgi:hypothetical protein
MLSLREGVRKYLSANHNDNLNRYRRPFVIYLFICRSGSPGVVLN